MTFLMKKAVKNLLPLWLAGALTLSACETVLDLPEPAHTPRLAVSYTLDTSAPDSNTLRHRQLYVSTSRRLFDNTPLVGRKDAVARLFDGSGAVVEEFRAGRPYRTGYYYNSDSTGYYTPTRGFVGVPGQTYRLVVAAPGVETAESILTLPPAPATITASSLNLDNTNPDFLHGSMSVTIQDDPATADYYAAFARVVDVAGVPVPNVQVQAQYDDDSGPDTNVGRLVLSDGDATGSLSVWPFADTDVQGRTFTFASNLEIRSYYYTPGGGSSGIPPGSQLEITISRLTRDTHRFWLSQQRYNSADGNPFAEPAPLFSNISTGFGLFGGAVDAKVRVAL